MEIRQAKLSIDGVISAVGSTLAAIFGFLVWKHQMQDDSLSVTITSYVTNPNGFYVDLFVANNSRQPVRINKYETLLGTIANDGPFDPSTGRNEPPIDTGKRTKDSNILLFPQRSENIRVDVIQQNPPKEISVKAKRVHWSTPESGYFLVIRSRRG